MYRTGGHYDFVEIFCLTGRKQKALQRNLSVFRKFSGIENTLWVRVSFSRFPVEILMSHSAKKIVGIPSMFQKIWGIEKFYA